MVDGNGGKQDPAACSLCYLRRIGCCWGLTARMGIVFPCYNWKLPTDSDAVRNRVM